MSRFKQLMKRGQDQQGFGLAETLVAVAILGTAVVSFVVSLSAGSLAVNEQNTETGAQNLAQTQMEYTKNYTYNPAAATYPTVAAPAGYTVNVSVGSVAGTDTNMQKITVTVFQNGSSVFLLSDYKVNR